MKILFFFSICNFPLAHTVSHFSYAPLFQGYFLTKMLESNILYDYLLIDILTVCWHQKILESLLRNILLRQRQFWQKCVCWTSIFSICVLCKALSMAIIVTEKHQNNYFIQVKPLFLVVEFRNTITIWRNDPFDIILTSVTIIKQVFLRKLFCHESLVDIEVSKH